MSGLGLRNPWLQHAAAHLLLYLSLLLLPASAAALALTAA